MSKRWSRVGRGKNWFPNLCTTNLRLQLYFVIMYFFWTETPVCQSWSTKGDHITQEQGFRIGAKAFSSTDPCGKKKKILAFLVIKKNYYRDLNGFLDTLKKCIICSSLPQNECCWRIKYESNRWRMDLQDRLMFKNVELFQNWWRVPSCYQTNRVQTHFSRQ